MYEKHILNPECNKAGGREAIQKSSVFLKKMPALASKRNIDSWTALHRLVSIQKVPEHMMHLLGNVHRDALLCEVSQHMSLSN